MNLKALQLVQTSQAAILSDLHNLDSTIQKQTQEQITNQLRITLEKIMDGNSETVEEHFSSFNDLYLQQIGKQILQKLEKPSQIEEKKQINPKTVTTEERTKEKPQERRDDKKNEKRSSSLVKGMLGKIFKTEDNARQMILPKDDRKPVYDPKTRKYIFDGEEPQPEREIPKPPPKGKNASMGAKPKKQQSTSGIESLCKPAGFKRKGGSKKQIKSQASLVEEPTIMNIELFKYKLMNQFEQLKKELSQIEDNSLTYSSKEKISAQQPIKEKALMKLLELNEEIQSIRGLQETMIGELVYENKQDDENCLKLDIIANNVQNLINAKGQPYRDEGQLYELKRKITGLEEEKQNYEAKYKKLDKQKAQNNKKLDEAYELLRSELVLQRQKSQELNHKLKEKSDVSGKQYKNLIAKVKNLEATISELDEKNLNLEEDYDSLENRKQKQISKIKQQSEHLKSTISQKENKISELQEYIKDIMENKSTEVDELRSRMELLQEFSQTINQQNQLYQSIQAKRLALYAMKEPQTEVHTFYEEEKEQNSILEMSGTTLTMVQSYENKIMEMKQNLMEVKEKYSTAKSLLNKNRQNNSFENQSLQRSINRLKSLNETYKLDKEEAEIKSSQLEIQYEKLKKQIMHLKKQNVYTKQLLEKSIKSAQDNTATLKEELERNIQQLEDEIQEKQGHNVTLIKQIEQIESELTENLNEKSSLHNKIKILEENERKLKNTVIELQETIDEERRENKNLSQELQNFELSIQQYKEQEKRQNQLKKKIKELEKRISDNKEQMEGKVAENEEILTILDELNIKMQTKENQTENLKSMNEQLNEQLSERSEEIKKISEDFHNIQEELQTYRQINEEQSQKIQSILSVFKEHKQEAEEVEKCTQQKIEYLIQELQENEQITKNLTVQLQNYEKLVQVLGEKLQQVKVVQNQSKLTELQEERDTFQQITVEMEEQIGKLNEKKDQINKQLENTKYLVMELMEEKKQKEELLQNEKQMKEQLKEKLLQLQKEKKKEGIETMQIVQQLEKQITQLQQKVRQLEKQTKQIQQRMNEQKKLMNEEINTLIKHTEKKDLRIKQIEQEFMNYTSEETQKKEEITLLNTQIQELLYELQQKDDQIMKLKNHHQNQKNVQTLEADLKEKSLLLSANQDKLNSIEGQMQNMKVRQEEMLKKLQIYETEIKKKENDIKVLLSEIEDKNEKKSQEFQKKSKETLTEKNKLITNIQTMKQESEQKEKIIQEKEEKNRQLLQQIQQLKNKNLILSQDLVKLNEKVESFNQKKVSEEKVEEEELQMLLITQEKQINQLMEENEKIKGKIPLKQEQIEKLKKQKSQLEEISNIKSEQAQKSIEKLEQQIRGYEKNNTLMKTLQGKYKELQAENIELLKEKQERLRLKDQTYEKEVGIPPKQEKKIGDPQKKSGGFFSSLSTLFLTETENEKLGKGMNKTTK